MRWYCKVSRHNEHDAIEGAVFGFLSRAKEVYAEEWGGDAAYDHLFTGVLDAHGRERGLGRSKARRVALRLQP